MRTNFIFEVQKIQSSYKENPMSNVNRIILVDFYTWFFKSTLSKNLRELNKIQVNENNLEFVNKQIITGQLFGLYRSYRKLLDDFLNTSLKTDKGLFRNNFLTFIFDRKHSKLLRKKESGFKEYKANRETQYKNWKQDNLFTTQSLFLNSLLTFGFYNEYFEADDVIVFIVNQYRKNQNLLKKPLVIDILSFDTDLIQILTEDDIFIVSDKKEFQKFLLKPKYISPISKKEIKVLVRYRYLKDENYRIIDKEFIEEKFQNLNGLYPQLTYWYKVIFGDQSDNIPNIFDLTDGKKRVSSRKKVIEYINDNLDFFLTYYHKIREFLKEFSLRNLKNSNNITSFENSTDVIKELYKELTQRDQEFQIKFIQKIEELTKRKIDLNQLAKNLSLIQLKDFQIDHITFTTNLKDYLSGKLEERYLENCKKYSFKAVPDFEKDYKPLFEKNIGALLKLVNPQRYNTINDEILKSNVLSTLKEIGLELNISKLENIGVGSNTNKDKDNKYKKENFQISQVKDVNDRKIEKFSKPNMRKKSKKIDIDDLI